MASISSIGNKKAKYDVEVLEEAVEAVRSKRMGLRKAAKHFKIAVSTLSDKVNGKTPITYVPHSLLTADEEKKLCQWALQMSEAGFGQTSDDILAKASAILDLRGGKAKDGTNMPSPAWVYRFFGRHPQLTLRTPMSLGKEQALVTPTTVEKWFAGLHAHIIQTDATLLTDPTRIFNADESGFSFDTKHRKVIACKGVKNVYGIESNTKTQMTVLAAMNAAGFYLPPMLIFPYKRAPGTDLLNGFPDAFMHISDNGWITAAIFFTWLRDTFIPKTKDIKKPLLLLVDSHISHTSLHETSEICEANGIVLYCLLAHASHLMQPLDQAFFGSIKSAWSKASRSHIAETGGAVGLKTFAKVFQPVWQKCATKANAESSYRAAGIFPFCPQRVLESKKMNPCRVYGDVPSSATGSSNQPATEPLPPAHQPKCVPEPPAPFQYESDDEGPESPAPFELPWYEPESSRPTPANRPSSPFEVSWDFEESTPASRPTSPVSQLFSPAPQFLSPAPQLHSPASQLPSPASISSHHVPAPNPEEGIYTTRQLEAIKDFGLYITDELGRNGFLRCFHALSRDAMETHEGFSKFKNLAASLKSSFDKQTVVTPSRAPLTLDNILKVTRFSGKGKDKKIKKTMPTMHCMLSGEEHREAILLKEQAKQKEDKEKLARKTTGEEKTRQRREDLEKKRLEKEMAKVTKQKKAAEMERKRQDRKDQTVLKKMEREAQRKRKRSESDEDDGGCLMKEMEQKMKETDDDDLESVESEDE